MTSYITHKNLEEYTYEELIRLRNQALENRNPIVFGEISDHLGKTCFPEGSLERELYEQYQTEKMKYSFPQYPQASQNPLFSSKIRLGDIIISIPIKDYNAAKRIVGNMRSMKWTKKNLVDIIISLNGNEKLRNFLERDYRILQLIGRIIYRNAKSLIK